MRFHTNTNLSYLNLVFVSHFFLDIKKVSALGILAPTRYARSILNPTPLPPPRWKFMSNNTHSGDCTIYASMCNGEPTDGICTCGYGLRKVREGDWSQVYSKEHPKSIE